MNVVFYPAISLDGFIARPDGDSNWVTAEDERMFADEVQKAGCVVVGSKTFRQYQGVIYPLPNATTFVCTSRPVQSADPRVQYLGGNVPEILEQIRKAGFQS